MKKHPLRDCAVEAFRRYAKNEIHKIEHSVSDKTAMKKTFDTLSHKYGNYAINVLKQVYFVRPNTPIKSGEIQNRVIRTSIENYIGEAQVYRILRTARDTFIKYRWGEMAECKYYVDGICVNPDSPMRADYCPVSDVPEVCRYEDRTPKERGSK